jgi:hypothetical protein
MSEIQAEGQVESSELPIDLVLRRLHDSYSRAAGRRSKRPKASFYLDDLERESFRDSVNLLFSLQIDEKHELDRVVGEEGKRILQLMQSHYYGPSSAAPELSDDAYVGDLRPFYTIQCRTAIDFIEAKLSRPENAWVRFDASDDVYSELAQILVLLSKRDIAGEITNRASIVEARVLSDAVSKIRAELAEADRRRVADGEELTRLQAELGEARKSHELEYAGLFAKLKESNRMTDFVRRSGEATLRRMRVSAGALRILMIAQIVGAMILGGTVGALSGRVHIAVALLVCAGPLVLSETVRAWMMERPKRAE